jgi:hypothetical protein
VSEQLFGPPDRLRIPGDGPVEYVGRLDDGTQYMSFVTGAAPDGYVFNDDWRKVNSYVAVLHLFDLEGNHQRSDVKHGGFDIDGRQMACDKAWAERHAMFTPYRGMNPQRCDIFVKLFSVVNNGITHGLVYRACPSEENGTGPTIEGVFLEPRDIMFHPPWDSADWST